MSQFYCNANNSCNNRVVENMADTKPIDYLNLVGNLKLAGTVRATDFIKDDGTSLTSVTVNKFALPNNVYYIDNKLGINEENPQASFDIKGTSRFQGGVSTTENVVIGGNLLSKGKIITEDGLAVSKSAIVGGSFLSVGDISTENNLSVGKAGMFGGNISSKGNVSAGSDLSVGKAGIFGGDLSSRGNVSAGSDLSVGKNAMFGGSLSSRGNVIAESDLSVGKNAMFGGNLLSRGIISGEDLSASRDINISRTANISGDINFNGANKWIIHTPDDNRSSMYIAPGNAKGEWMFDKQTIFDNTGNVQLSGALMVGNQNIAHPDNVDGAFYRADGQIQIASDDLIRLRHTGSKATGIQFDVREGAGDIQTPNGQMKITRQGIMFGGPNNAREVNSGQISAGLHHANSLNIVGMSADTGHVSRRVDMWAEGGFSVFGPQKINGPRIDDANNILNKQAQPSGQSVNSRGGWISSDMGAPNDQTRVVIGNLGNRATVGGHSANLGAWTPLHLNPDGDQPVVIGGSDGNAKLTIKGSANDHGTAWLRSDKGPNVSHIHWGPTGDWYIRSAKPEGYVILQDTGGIVRIGSAPSDANGQQLLIGNANESNLRLGRHADYSWIQSHGAKPLKINPLGNEVCFNDVCLTTDDFKKIKSGSNASIGSNSTNGLMYMIGYGPGGRSTKSLDINSITDSMNIVALLPVISTDGRSKAAIYFNIKIKDGAQLGKFRVTSDDGISFEYSYDSAYLNSAMDYGIPGQLNNRIIDNSGWKDQGATPYDYTIPNDTVFGNIIKCKLTWYQGGGGVVFQIDGLKTAILSVGTLV